MIIFKFKKAYVYKIILLISMPLLFSACNNNESNAIIDPIILCDKISLDGSHDKAGAEKDLLTLFDTQSIDVCEKIKKLTYPELTLKIDSTRIYIPSDQELMNHCDNVYEKITYEPVGSKYKKFITEVNKDSDCLGEISKLVGFTPIDPVGYSLRPEQSFAVYSELYNFDQLPSLRETSLFYSFPVFVVTGKNEVIVHCLILEEGAGVKAFTEDVFKFDCLQRL